MINPNDLKEILYNISKDIILPSFGNLKKNQISYKGGNDIVTDIDVSVEKKLPKQHIQMSGLLKVTKSLLIQQIKKF